MEQSSGDVSSSADGGDATVATAEVLETTCALSKVADPLAGTPKGEFCSVDVVVLNGANKADVVFSEDIEAEFGGETISANVASHIGAEYFAVTIPAESSTTFSLLFDVPSGASLETVTIDLDGQSLMIPVAAE
ncbi:hypothetical protein [Agromyces sp. PvR057]|uniref:hypothetical protein n=1 Tax=Agromyces sp. PvR057 TaxID=3156403 RepID=UPI003397309A